MAAEFTAQMSVYKGRWRLYVVLVNAGAAPWPEFSFDRQDPVPTFTERVHALSVLGFEPVPGAEWRWVEDSKIPDDPSSPVVLIAATRVRSWTGVGA
ncbi:hypothetical protein C3489_31100 [Streptomyces sp. Ru71]|uniref:DUF6303 family protein n=1 Tax=Streptomyces sp. Ru71 TaxID=2080746 RepID=UPI000CDDF933|nr:DUF6303 family protein [Streptomyces sp. Ru71]POX46841.1 hypothetical protein C3489_31100 [Streptomyces sp. Ru71]